MLFAVMMSMIRPRAIYTLNHTPRHDYQPHYVIRCYYYGRSLLAILINQAMLNASDMRLSCRARVLFRDMIC